MKTLPEVFQVIAFIILLQGCEKPIPVDHPNPVDLNKPSHAKHAEIPLDAFFRTEFSKFMVPEGHSYLHGTVMQLVQTGSGTDPEIGYFSVSLSCCWSVTDCLPGMSGGILTDGTGNSIFIKCMECLSGSDFTSDFPADQSHITGRFEFWGGSGLYENIEGEGTIDALVTNNGKIASITHHWKGYFRLPD